MSMNIYICELGFRLMLSVYVRVYATYIIYIVYEEFAYELNYFMPKAFEVLSIVCVSERIVDRQKKSKKKHKNVTT